MVLETPVWTLRSLDDVVTFKSGGTPSRSNEAYWGGSIPWFTAKDLKSFRLNGTIETVTERGSRSGTRLVPAGTVLVLVRGMTLLKRVPIGVTTRESAFNQDLAALVPGSDITGPFLAYLLTAIEPQLRGHVDIAGHGTGRMPVKALRRTKVRVPPLQEQDAIVDALALLDARLTSLAALISAKRRFKSGLMKELLTGKRRFKEFVRSSEERLTDVGKLPTDWDARALRELFTPVTRKNAPGVKLVLTASGERGLVDQRRYFNRSVAGEDLTSYYLLKKGEFAYNRSLMKGYPCGAIKRLDAHEEGALSRLYICFALSIDGHDPSFFTQVFESGLLNQQLSQVTKVGARAHGLLNVTGDDFFNVRVPVPSPGEQQRIASILTACDREIELLGRLREALDGQRRGVAELLLTGKVRVPA